MDLDVKNLNTELNLDDIKPLDLSNINVDMDFSDINTDIDFSNIDIDPKEMLEEAIDTLNEIDLEREDY